MQRRLKIGVLYSRVRVEEKWIFGAMEKRGIDYDRLDDRAIQAIMREVDIKDLATALKGTSPDVQEKIFHNMSERAVGMLKEDMEVLGPVRTRDVQKAQLEVVALARKLEEDGKVVLAGRGDDEYIV